MPEQRWKQEDVDALKLMYEWGDRQALLDKLDCRTWRQVICKAHKLGIKRKVKGDFGFKVLQMLRKGDYPSQIARELGITKESVSRQSHKFLQAGQIQFIPKRKVRTHEEKLLYMRLWRRQHPTYCAEHAGERRRTSRMSYWRCAYVRWIRRCGKRIPIDRDYEFEYEFFVNLPAQSWNWNLPPLMDFGRFRKTRPFSPYARTRRIWAKRYRILNRTLMKIRPVLMKGAMYAPKLCPICGTPLMSRQRKQELQQLQKRWAHANCVEMIKKLAPNLLFNENKERFNKEEWKNRALDRLLPEIRATYFNVKDKRKSKYPPIKMGGFTKTIKKC